MDIRFHSKSKQKYVTDEDLVFISSINGDQGVWRDSCNSEGPCWDLIGEPDVEAHLYIDGKFVSRVGSDWED